MANNYKTLGKEQLNDPIIGHPAMKGRRWMIDYGYDNGKTFEKLKDESMKYKDFFSEFENKPSEQNNKLKGGIGDTIASEGVDTSELSTGVQVEMEHTNDINVATEIALDHLAKDPEYYTKLVKAGLAKEFIPSTNSGLGDTDHPINDTPRTGHSNNMIKNVIGTIGDTSDGEVLGRRSEPIIKKDHSSDNTKGCDCNLNEKKSKKKSKKPKPTNPELWARAKSAARSKFDVYPSAYANGWAAKWYKSKGGGWRM